MASAADFISLGDSINV